MGASRNGEFWHALSQRIARGDRQAFDLAHRTLGGSLRQMILRWSGTRALAEEIAQNAWMQAWRAVCEQRYDPSRASFVTFVYAIAHRLWLRQRRQLAVRRRIERQIEQQTPREQTDCPDPAADLHQAELIDAVRAALRDAAGGLLDAEELRVLRGLAEGLSERELAAQMSRSASTIHARKHAGLRKLALYLRQRGLHAPERTGGSGE